MQDSLSTISSSTCIPDIPQDHHPHSPDHQQSQQQPPQPPPPPLPPATHSAPVSHSSSPSSGLPSPPESPSSGSVSSFPSVSSSFFFSSAAASPPHSHPQSDHHDLSERLIIPSLTLPPALKRPTPYGQSIGDLRLLVLGTKDTSRSFLTGILLEENEVVVEVGPWEDRQYGRVLYASTDWIEHKDAHGYEKYEPTRNVEFVELPEYDPKIENPDILDSILSIIHGPFYALSDVLSPDSQPSSLIASLLSSSATPLYTAMILLLPSAPTTFDRLLISELGKHIPLIILPRLRSHSRTSSRSSLSSHSGRVHPQHTAAETDYLSTTGNDDHHKPFTRHLSSFKPSTAISLRSGLFNSPETLAQLRSEATDKFLRWREVYKVVGDLRDYIGSEGHRGRHDYYYPQRRRFGGFRYRWDKAKWEAEYLADFSRDVAVELGKGRQNDRRSMREDVDEGLQDTSGDMSVQSPSRYLSVYNQDSLQSDTRSQDDLVQGSVYATYSNAEEHVKSDSEYSDDASPSHPHPLPFDQFSAPFDPLHFPSLILFSLSLLSPLRSRMKEAWGDIARHAAQWVALDTRGVNTSALLGLGLGIGVGGFCVGLGVGLVMNS